MTTDLSTDVSAKNHRRSLALELKQVAIRFSGNAVLRDISLQIPSGSSLVIIGPSGQGKTVLLKLLAGLIVPTVGTLFVNELDFHGVKQNEQKNLLKKMGMLFQKNALFDSFTCGENIAFPLRETTGLSENEIQTQVEYFLSAVGIPHAKDLFPDEISGGMQKRLGIARALALNPEIIFYDDPTAGLDPITSRKIVDLILDLQKKNGTTVVSITNDMNRAYQLAGSIAMVIDQQVLVSENVEMLKQNEDPRVHQFISGSLDGPLLALN